MLLVISLLTRFQNPILLDSLNVLRRKPNVELAELLSLGSVQRFKRAQKWNKIAYFRVCVIRPKYTVSFGNHVRRWRILGMNYVPTWISLVQKVLPNRHNPRFANDVPTIILDTRSSTEGVTDFCYSLNSFSNRGKKKLIILKWNTAKRNKIKPKWCLRARVEEWGRKW